MLRPNRQTHYDRSRGGPAPANLPDLSPNVTLLDAETDIRPSLHALTIDELRLSGASGKSTALWVDTGRHAQTTSLHDLTPSPRVLDRIHLARGFTAFQHHALIRNAIAQIDATTVAFVVPAVDAPYRDSDLPRERARDLLLRVLAHLSCVPRQYNISVLVTTSGADDLAAPVNELATDILTYRETRCGPRFEGADHDTLVYDVGDGWVQTTLAYWQQVLEMRRPLYASQDDAIQHQEVA
ncbi:hypothetical protein [Halobacterium salinarum]|uniref:hypothetical protein n=1 Tax=Halobacterium salinarum TaxID=2242 RepID=UPI0025548156|nr:hypothetical protein [Halobacterium salinarum]MDL0127626.1 hypothetical protein [Halobacterium salinarum]